MTSAAVPPTITIRPAAPADAPALTTLSQLDSAPVPRGRLLVAELGGRLVAALSVETGTAIADPFSRTDDLVELLRRRAAGRSAATRAAATHRFGLGARLHRA